MASKKGLLAVSVLTACSSSPSGAPTCFGAAEQALVNGAAQESYLGLAPSQIDAIVLVVDGSRADGALCSGAVVAPGWVVTARHCLAIVSPEIQMQGEGESPFARYPVIDTAAHPSLDIALMQMDVSTADAGLLGRPISPLQPGGTAIAHLATGDIVELAGYGLTETRQTRSLRFLAEPILAIDDTLIAVTGRGESGACEGDSGGPLLVRDPTGAPLVAGVLYGGSPSCRDEDRYVRLDRATDWITSVVGARGEEDRACGAITEEGRCLFGAAMWCSGATLQAEPCSGSKTCGWSQAERAFRCVDASDDACGTRR